MCVASSLCASPSSPHIGFVAYLLAAPDAFEGSITFSQCIGRLCSVACGYAQSIVPILYAAGSSRLQCVNKPTLPVAGHLPVRGPLMLASHLLTSAPVSLGPRLVLCLKEEWILNCTVPAFTSPSTFSLYHALKAGGRWGRQALASLSHSFSAGDQRRVEDGAYPQAQANGAWGGFSFPF